MAADVDLKWKPEPSIWEKPRNLAIVVSVACLVAGTASGWLGYSIARSMSGPQVIIL